MVAWAIKNFGGMIPRTNSRDLPDNMAELVTNCDVSSGTLVGLPAPAVDPSFSSLAITVNRAYRFPDPAGIGHDLWVPLPSKFSSVVKSPLANDSKKRLYWTNPGGLEPPHFINYDEIIALYPLGIYDSGTTPPHDLGIPQPLGTGLGVSVSGGTGPTVYRSYTYTHVNSYGEESAPLTPSNPISGASDGTWSITGLPTSAPSNPAGFNYLPVTKIRLYRTLTGNQTGAQFFLVHEFTFGTDNPTNPYTDTTTDTAIVSNELLPSSGWANPPNVDHLISLAGGMIVGFAGNTVYFCEPNRPHAWPPAYAQSFEHQIASLGVWQQSLVVATFGFPYIGSGNSPANYVFSAIHVPEPCLCGGSLISDLMGVYYASQNGLIQISYLGMQNQTLAMATKLQWINLIADSGGGFNNFIACRHRSQYFGLNNTKTGFFIDYAESRMGVVELSFGIDIESIWTDDYSGQTFMLGSDKTIYTWDPASSNSPLIFRWRSKQFYLPAPASLGACLISFEQTNIVNTHPLTFDDPDLTIPSGYFAVFKLYAGSTTTNPNLVLTKNLNDARSIFRLPSGFKAMTWQVEIISYAPVVSIELASTMKELRGV